MPISKFLALTDDALADAYNVVPIDPAKARKPFLRALDKALKQFEDGKQPRGENALWSANNNIVKFTPKVGGTAVELDGKTEFHIPSERFETAISELRKSIEAGDLDDALSADAGGRASSSTPRPSKQRAGWSPERRAAFEKRIAERKAAKNTAVKSK